MREIFKVSFVFKLALFLWNQTLWHMHQSNASVACWPSGRASDSESRGPGFEPSGTGLCPRARHISTGVIQMMLPVSSEYFVYHCMQKLAVVGVN